MTPIFGRVRGRRRVKIPAQGAASLAIFDASGIVTCSAGLPLRTYSAVFGGMMFGAQPISNRFLKVRVLPACHRCQDIAKYVAEFPPVPVPLCAVRHAQEGRRGRKAWRASGRATVVQRGCTR
jgi:hypothetical protein